MVIAGATTAIAVAAVITVIGFRISAAGGNTMGAVVDGMVTLPKGARVIATGVSAGRIVVTLEINGTNEMRVFDIKTLKETGRLRFRPSRDPHSACMVAPSRLFRTATLPSSSGLGRGPLKAETRVRFP